MFKIFAIIFVTAVSLDCIFSDDGEAIYDPVPILTYKESPENPSEQIPSIIAYGCPAGNKKNIDCLTSAANNKVRKSPKLLYCIFRRSAKNPKNSKCQKPVRPIFLPTVENKRKIVCGFSENHHLYSFGFYSCGSGQDLKEFRRDDVKKDPRQFYKGKIITLETYDVCYDTTTNETIWTRHKLAKPIIFDKIKLKNKKLSKNISTDPFLLQNTNFETIKTNYNLESTNPSNKMLPQPLVPPVHFAFDVWKKTTNHIINMAPLGENLVALMTAIDEGMKTAQMKYYSSNPITYSRLKFYTRVITEPATSSTSNDQQRFQPNIWHKFIYDEAGESGVMIYLHNTPGQPPKAKNCNTLTCNFNRWTSDINVRELISDNELQYAYCCEANETVIENIFSSNVKVTITRTLDMNLILGINKRDFDTSMGGSEMVEEDIKPAKRSRMKRAQSL